MQTNLAALETNFLNHITSQSLIKEAFVFIHVVLIYFQYFQVLVKSFGFSKQKHAMIPITYQIVCLEVISEDFKKLMERETS